MFSLILISLAAGTALISKTACEFFLQREIAGRLPVDSEAPAENKFKTALDKFLFFTPLIVEKLRIDKRIKPVLDAARARLTPIQFLNIKIIILIAITAGSIAARVEPLIMFIGLGLGFAAPDIYLFKRIAGRRQAIARVLPETVDLLGLCIEAGLDFTSSIKWVVDKAQANPMIEELMFVMEEIKWGKSRVQALKDMAKRLNVPEVSSFVQTLVQAERMGTPVSEAFTILSEDTRLQRFHRGERIAMQAPIKILFPLIFCILPVIGIIIGGPILLQFTSGGLLKGLG